VRKSANAEKRWCYVAQATLKANLNGARDDYRSRPTSAVRCVPSRRNPSHSLQSVAWQRRPFSPQEQAAIRFAVNLVQGKWKIGILCRLQEGPARMGDLRRLFPQASKKMLTQHLRQMERDELILRSDLSGKVPHVEYSLSEPRGVAFSRLFHFLTTWSEQYRPQDACNVNCDLAEWHRSNPITLPDSPFIRHSKG
jgi:DNA-binding HxlR family transcriptional regulator